MSNKNPVLVEILSHPIAGESRRDPGFVAIRWRPGATVEAKNQVLQGSGLELAEVDRAGTPPLPGVNQTDGLSWVRPRDGGPISPQTVADLEASERVAWVAPAFRAQRGETSPASLFTVNPERLYVNEQALDRVGGV